MHKNDLYAANNFKNELMKRITPTTDYDQGARNQDLIIEAIVENLEIKQELFARLDQNAPAHCIFASNTSGLSIKSIAQDISADRQSKFGGLHFFNPVPMMKLLEVVQAEGMTSDATFAALDAYGKKVGQTTVKCGDTPGFLVNRLLVSYMNEAGKLHDRGHGSIEDIDTAMKLGAGHPMGPFELYDYTGLDTGVSVLSKWSELYPEMELFRPSDILVEMVKEGKVGKKVGQGFYKWENNRIVKD